MICMQKVLRSLIHELFPLELRYQIELLSLRRDITNQDKQDELLKLLKSFNIPDIVQLGPGTNRYAFRVKGFAIKIATDKDGKIDNLKEFKMSKRLYPYVIKVYEISENNTILVTEYIQPFISYGEMQAHAIQIKEILNKLSKVYLIGDVGITSKNFGNWGTRIGSDNPVCLDFAYVYDVSSSLFICNKCKANAMLVPDTNYTKLICSNPGCQATFTFEDIRRKISLDMHLQEIGDMSQEAYILDSSNVKTELTPERSRYLMKDYKKHKKDEDDVLKEEEPTPDNFVMEHEPEFYIQKKKQEETNSMDGNLILEARMFGEQFAGKKSNRPVIVATPIREISRKDIPEMPFENKESIDVIAKPVPSQTKLAFEGKMDPDNSIDKLMDDIPSIRDLKEYEESDEPKEAEETNHTDVEVVEETKQSTNDNLFIPQFVNNMHRAISKLSTKIHDNLYDQELYETIRADLTTTNGFYPGDFYRIVQNAIFRSLTIYLDMEPTEITNQKTGKNSVIYKAPDDLNNCKYYPMLKFIERFWINRDINDLEKVSDIMERYRSLYDDYLGMDRNWIPTFTARLAGKLTIADKFTIQKIADIIANDWCDNTSIDTDTVDNSDNLEVDSNNTVQDTKDSKLQSTMETRYEAEDDSLESNEENDDTSLVSVEIYSHEKFDIIKVKYTDDTGENTIPIKGRLADYTNINKILPTPKTEEENRLRRLAGIWGWLYYITPDFIFTTTDPEHWLKKNNYTGIPTDDLNKTYKYAILGYVDNCWIIGLYCVEGIYLCEKNPETGDDELNLTDDPTILAQVNNMILSTFANSSNNVNLDDIDASEIHTEEEILDILKSITASENESKSEDQETTQDDEEEYSDMEEFAEATRIGNLARNNNNSKEDESSPVMLTPIRRK